MTEVVVPMSQEHHDRLLSHARAAGMSDVGRFLLALSGHYLRQKEDALPPLERREPEPEPRRLPEQPPRTGIGNHSNRHGNHNGRLRALPSEEQEAAIRRMYDNYESIQDIAAAVGANRATVRRWMTDIGLPVRPRGPRTDAELRIRAEARKDRGAS